MAFGCIWALFVAPWCLCYRTSKSRLSDHGIQQLQVASAQCKSNVMMRHWRLESDVLSYLHYAGAGAVSRLASCVVSGAKKTVLLGLGFDTKACQKRNWRLLLPLWPSLRCSCLIYPSLAWESRERMHRR